MRSRWGEDIDEELQQKHEKIKVGFVFNYIQINRLLTRISEETREWDEKYPKSELKKIWACDMLFMFIFSLISYNILIIVSGLFFIFYGHILIRISGVFKRFKYSRLKYWGTTIVGLAAVVALGILCQNRLLWLMGK